MQEIYKHFVTLGNLMRYDVGNKIDTFEIDEQLGAILDWFLVSI